MMKFVTIFETVSLDTSDCSDGVDKYASHLISHLIWKVSWKTSEWFSDNVSHTIGPLRLTIPVIFLQTSLKPFKSNFMNYYLYTRTLNYKHNHY